MYTNVTYVWAKLNISTAVQSAGDEVSILNSMDKKPVILQVEVVGAGGSTPDMDINISRKPLSVAFPALSSASLHRNRSLKRGSVPPRCTLGSAVLHQFFLRNGSN